jgi:hypothetical protein
VTVLEPHEPTPSDAAVAIVIARADHDKAGSSALVGFGSSTGAYLRPGEPVLAPVVAAGQRACDSAGVTFPGLASIVVGGLDVVHNEELASAFGVQEANIDRADQRTLDLGYAGGLLALERTLAAGESGRHLVVSAGGIGLDNAHAVVVESP